MADRTRVTAAGAAALAAGVLLPDSRLSSAVRQEPSSLETFAIVTARSAEEAGPGGWKGLLAQARRESARYALLPHLEGAPEPVPGPLTEELARAAREVGIWIAVSLPERREGGHHLTTVLLDGGGRIAARHRQVILSDSGALRGDFRDTVETVDVDGLRLGVVAAEDALVGVPRLADRGADAIFVSRGTVPDDGALDERLRGLSAEYGVSLITAAPPGREGTDRPHGRVYGFSGESIPLREQGRFALATLTRRSLPWRIPSALGLPASVPFPSHRPPTPDEAELGRRLFLEKGLSETAEVSCSSCHEPENSFAGGKPKGTGVHGRQTKRNVPSLLNVAFRPLLQWDGYASSLENFAKYPINGFNEMASHYLDEVVPYLRRRPDYVESFREAMGAEPIEFDHVARALATYQRTLISGDSAFDRYHYGGDRAALGPAARRGLAVFIGRGDCARCHVIGDRYALFTDLEYHDLGVGYRPELGKYSDIGLGGISTDDFSGLFQTPSLRNVAETAPYMHDGSVPTLEEAVDIHDRGGLPSPHRDPSLRPLGLTRHEKQDLVAFLRSLTGVHAYTADGRRLPSAEPRPAPLSRGDPHAPTASPSPAPGRLRRAAGPPPGGGH